MDPQAPANRDKVKYRGGDRARVRDADRERDRERDRDNVKDKIMTETKRDAPIVAVSKTGSRACRKTKK
eukprot:COSAG03_NODE_15669_length_423_cov_2.558642_1_plen_69_part_00